jgi:hypothetical protein
LSIVGAFGLAVSGVLPRIEKGEWKWTSPTGYAAIFILSLFISIIGGVSLARRTKGNATLKDELQRNVQRIVEDSGKITRIQNKLPVHELAVMSQILGFGDSERISFYIHNGETLVMNGRFSTSPKYLEPGRRVLRDDAGVIGKAWQNGYAFVDNLPEVTGNDDYAYRRSCDMDWDMTDAEARALKMKSRTIGACAIQDSKDKRIAVVVFESMKASGFTEADLAQLLDNNQRKRLSLLLEEIQAITPSLSLAHREGF